MIRTLIISGLLASSVLAGDSCPAPPKKPSNGNFAGGPGASSTPNVGTHTWSRVAPSDVLSSLHAKGINPVTKSTGGYCSSTITLPSGYTSISQTASTTNAASTTASGASYTKTPTTLATSTSSSGSSSASATKSAKGSASSSSSSSSASSGSASSSSGKSSTTSASSSSSSSTSATKTSSSSTHSSSTSASTSCASPRARVEWRNMSPAEQEAITQANKCLMLAPPRAGLTGAKSRWDELVVIHQQMVDKVHGTGFFLMWHRQFLWVYEQELRNYCSYTGALPWWDETLDSGDYHNAPMFTSQLYGSAPEGPQQCITDGAYAGSVLNIGPGSSDVPHCLSRGVNESISAAVTNDFVGYCNANPDFATMQNCQFAGVHGFTHDAVGGVLSDVASSPGDAIFYQHHTFVDRNFRNWQLVDPQTRTYDIGGYTTQECINGGSGCTLVTLNDALSTLGYQPDVTIAQVADTQGEHLCYYYDY